MIGYSVRKPLTIFLAALAVIILGVVAFTRMTPDLLPNMDFPYVVIMTAYPGASPETVEAEVTKPLEQAMSTLEHIREVSSSSSENYSILLLEFEDSVNLDTIGVDIQQNIVSLSGQWGDGVGTPYVLKINPSLLPVEAAAVSMEGLDAAELSDFVDETLLPRLEGVSGVARITAMGSVTRQVHVVIDQEKIDEVNRRLADTVNQKLDDAREELEKTREELSEAQKALEEAESQLAEGRDTLLSQTASAEVLLEQQTVTALTTRMDLQQQLVTLTDTASQLETTLKIVRPLYARLTNLEAREAELSDRAEALAAARDRLTAAEDALAALETGAPAAGTGTEQEAEPGTEAPAPGAALSLTADGAPEETQPAPPEETDEAPGGDAAEEPGGEPEAEPQGEPDGESGGPDIGGTDIDLPVIPPEDGESEELRLAREELDAAVEALEALGSGRYTAGADLIAVRAELAALRAELALVDAALEGLKLSREDLGGTVAGMEEGLAQARAGMELLNDALSQLDEGTLAIGEAQGTLTQAESEGLLQLAQAAAQIEMNAGTVDSALTQVDAGLESLEDTREESLASADLSDSITMSTVSAILAAQNFSMPAGYVDQDGVSTMVSVGEEITDPDELRELVLFDTGAGAIGPVTLSDVAEVFVTDNADETYARLDGEHGLILLFEKQSNAATADVTEALGRRFAQLEESCPGLRFVSLMDQGEYIRIIVRSILESLAYGAVFAILVLLLFLRDIRPTFITLVSIPISVVFAVVLMYFSGVTLNMISLSGLAVAVGMLVDNSIVVIENIYRLRARGATAPQAAAAGARQVAGAITASTLTTVCVFLPIVFVEGLTRQLFTDLALTMGYSLMASLIVALTLVPALARGMLGRERGRGWGGAGGGGRLARGYRALLGRCLDHKWAVLTLAAVLLGLSAWLAIARGFSFMPDIDMNTVDLTITMPEDISREEAAALADEVLARVRTVDHVQTAGAMMGGSSLLSAAGGEYDVTAYVTLDEGASGAAAGREIQALCADLPCEITADSQLMDTSYLTGSGVAVSVYGSDMTRLQEAARQVAGALAEVEGIEEVDDGLADSVPALRVRVDRNAAMERGWTVAQIYAQIAARLTTSATAMTMDTGGVTADVLVEEGGRVTREALEAMEFSCTDEDGKDAVFPLSEVAEVEETLSLAAISRENQRRTVGVAGTVAGGYSVTHVTADARRAVEALSLPEGITWAFSGENEATMEAVEQLLLLLLLGMVLVYFIMAAQFQSLKSPFIVMFTIPLAFTGGFLALLITGFDVSVVSLVGFVMLTGVIVNNGIVLVDCVNQLRAGGTPRREALLEAGVTRLRPILMTSLTTILGLLVMALGLDAGTMLMQPVAIVCIGGLLYATLMTLVVVPCICEMVNKKDLTVVRGEDLVFDENAPAPRPEERENG